MPKRVFVIYGRDTEAHDELVKFLSALGIEEVRFESVANALGPHPFIADIVLSGIGQADALIALFTPDEHAALYEPRTGRAPSQGGSRWQARPNVIFEAGIAYGSSSDKLILAVLGADVRLFSDVSGVHFVQLAEARGKRNLFEKLDKLVGPIKPILPDWETSPKAGDFIRYARQRWEFFDEVHVLEGYLKNRRVKSKSREISVFKVVQKVVERDPRRAWHSIDARDFMEAVKGHFDDDITDDSYWWLIVYGFFRFENIKNWGISGGATWDDSCDKARLTERGAALIERLRTLRVPHLSRSTRK